MNGEVKEPEPVALTSEEFIEKLHTEYSRDIKRLYNKTIFERDPEKYRRQGLNEYLEREEAVAERMVLPPCSERRLHDMARDSNVSIELLESGEPEITMVLARGTPASMRYFKRALMDVFIDLPEEMRTSGAFKLLDIPQRLEEKIIGKSGVNVYRIQDEYGVTVRVICLASRSCRALAISGEAAKVDEACAHVLGIICRNTEMLKIGKLN
jgi:hypothetical protein